MMEKLISDNGNGLIINVDLLICLSMRNNNLRKSTILRQFTLLIKKYTSTILNSSVLQMNQNVESMLNTIVALVSIDLVTAVVIFHVLHGLLRPGNHKV